MEYITGIYALNLNCPSLGTPGDWHQSSYCWDNVPTNDSQNSVFKNYGIEPAISLPGHPDNTLPVANHIRACLDLLEQLNFGYAQGMKDDYIVTDEYDKEIFQKVSMLKSKPFWEKIDKFMMNEYRLKWLRYKKENNL